MVSAARGHLNMPTMTKQVMRIAVAAALFIAPWFAASDAIALVVEATGTNVNPASYPGWTQGDPGWDNVTQNGANYVYLGNGWVLTARHVGAGPVHLSTGSFSPIASQNYVIQNPPPAKVGGLTLTAETDLLLFRINGDPGLPSLSIATQSPPSTGTNGSQVLFVGTGRTRFDSVTHWNVNTSWTEGDSGNYHGYKTTNPNSPDFTPNVKRWGTNRLENPGNIPSVFTAVPGSATSGVLTVRSGQPPNHTDRQVISLLSIFTPPEQALNPPGVNSVAGVLTHEAQVVDGDSGSAVFYKNGSQWQLAGIVNQMLTYANQSKDKAVYGNGSTFADLSYYNKPYQGSICDVMLTCGNYSSVGDVNLDGIVSGDGTGPVQSDDVAAFIAGWKYDNGKGGGNYLSWTHGDLNHDGITNVSDFLLLRSALNGQISGAALTMLFGSDAPDFSIDDGSTVPEPSAAFLAIAIAVFFACGTWGRICVRFTERPRRDAVHHAA